MKELKDFRTAREKIFNFFIDKVFSTPKLVISDERMEKENSFLKKHTRYDYFYNLYYRLRSEGKTKRKSKEMTVPDYYLAFKQLPAQIMVNLVLNKHGVYIGGLGYFSVDVTDGIVRIKLYQTSEIRKGENIMQVYNFVPHKKYTLLARYMIMRGLVYENHSDKFKLLVKQYTQANHTLSRKTVMKNFYKDIFSITN